MSRIIYVPLESYSSRYTEQLSRPVTGWWERNWREYNIPFLRIDTEVELTPIETGQVLDATTRSLHSMEQIHNLLIMIKHGHYNISPNDVIYFDDFWQPGIEALAYQMHQLGIKIPMYAFCWAQSVDKYDFTHGMKKWIRHYEKGNAAVLDGIFVANTKLKKLLVRELKVSHKKVHVVGLPFSSEEVLESSGLSDKHKVTIPDNKKKKVVFTSRFDREKQPHLFSDMALELKTQHPDVEFVMCSPHKTIKSNCKNTASEIAWMALNKLITLKLGLTKQEYYKELAEAAIQVNTALQDWVSFTLLEALTFQCFPVYPKRRSFPETFTPYSNILYETGNDNGFKGLVNMVHNALVDFKSTPPEIWNRSNEIRYVILNRNNDTWKRIYNVMFPKNTLFNGIAEIYKEGEQGDGIPPAWLKAKTIL